MTPDGIPTHVNMLLQTATTQEHGTAIARFFEKYFLAASDG